MKKLLIAFLVITAPITLPGFLVAFLLWKLLDLLFGPEAEGFFGAISVLAGIAVTALWVELLINWLNL